MNTVKWGVLSGAEIAVRQVVPAILKAPNAEVAAVASESGKEVKLKEQFNVSKAYSSYTELLNDPEIDAVYIPLPNGLHAKWVKEAAKHKKHVLCEKPASLTYQEAVEMMQVCEENNVIFMESFMYQFHPQHNRVKEVIHSGEIGEVKHMNSDLSFVLHSLEGNIRSDRNLGGGSLYDLGCYQIHAIRMILGEEPVRVFGMEQLYDSYDVDQAAAVTMEMESGLLASFNCSMNMAGRQTYEVVGTKGKITVSKAYVPHEDGIGKLTVDREDGHHREEILEGYFYEIGVEHLSSRILEGREPVNTAENTIQNMRVLEACLTSMQKKQPVEVTTK
ncbi:Gfo/Idh/MocA family protein [Oceanobacillus locisalsi]|uniref:Gfo/Idh/MocA family protein n=1 Tax=Oceanobacillus locisalsi TaxID=546107 RepID=A0ABW3NC39_9BACI